jgi:hypothetical protein
MSFAKEYLATVISRLKYYKDLGDKTFAQLNNWDFHYQSNEESNSIAIIIRHLSGNMLSRWTNFMDDDGEKEWRQRDDEFAIHSHTKQELIEEWEKGWSCLFNAIESLKKKQLKKTVLIRKEPLSVIDAINRQLAHYPYHVGQIVHIAKIIKGKNFQSLSIPRNGSQAYNASTDVKDPAKNFK